PLQARVDAADHQHHHGDHGGVGPRLAEFGHVLEVHAVPAGEQGGGGEHRGPAGEFLHHFVLAEGDQRQVDVDRGGEHFAHRADRFVDPEYMVEDVAKVWPQVVGYQVRMQPHQLAGDVLQWRDGEAQCHQVALHVVQPVHGAALEGLGEDVVLEQAEFLTAVAHDGQQIVDDEVEHAVQAVAGSVGKQLRGVFAGTSRGRV